MIDMTKEVVVIKCNELLDIAVDVMTQDPDLLELTAANPTLVLFGFVYLSKIMDKIFPKDGQKE